MALTERTVVDKIDIYGEFRNIGIRTATVIEKDGVEISRTFDRRGLECQSSTDDGVTWTDTDISGESAEIQGICATVWTDEVKAAYRDSLTLSQPDDVEGE